MASRNLTDNQRMLAKTLDFAAQEAIAYAAPEVPELGNLTPEGLLESLGRLNEARKAFEKVEKIVRARFESQINGKTELRGDNYTYSKAVTPRYALNQSKAKKLLEEAGIPEDQYMESSEVPRVTVKRN
jgi:ABC-type transport system substrate-binding protein